jgi:hypothetical protein
VDHKSQTQSGSNLESSVPRAREQVVQLEDELAITTMGSKDYYLSNFTLFEII